MNTARFVVRSNIICRFTILTLVSLILPISMLVGCGAKLSVFPEVSEYPKQVAVLLRGEIVYEGKPEYRPRTIAGGGESKLNLYYVYEDSHSRNDPMLTRSGIPIGLQKIGSKSQYVVGNLEIRNGEKVLRTYTAIATLTDQSEFSESLSEMRRRGLIAVRDNIEAQMYLDSEFLRNLPR